MEAQLKNATDSLNRLEPLLPKEFVTPGQDRPGPHGEAHRRRRGSTRRGGRWTRPRRTSVISRRCSPSGTRRRRRSARRSWISSFCYVRAQFDALVVNLHTAIGAVRGARPGAGVLARGYAGLVRHGGLSRDRARAHRARDGSGGVRADRPAATAFAARVQGIGWAVNPEDQPIVPGVPQVKRELELGAHRAAVSRAHPHREPGAATRLPRRRLGRRDHPRLARRHAAGAAG